jgi:short-subunit dehydrogenase
MNGEAAPDTAMASLQPITLVTGASAGIGAALADVFADRGHKLVLVARRAPQLHSLADRIAERGHERPTVLPLDLARFDATARIADELSATGVEPQYVVNNAGFGLLGPASSLDRAEQLAMIDLNVRALTDLSLRFTDSLARHRGGILNVASVSAFMPGPGMTVYFATKAYVLSFGEALHQELKPLGIRVTTLCPGPVETEFQARAGMGPAHFSRRFFRSAERVAREGYEGLMRGQRVIVPGSHNKVAALMPRLLPRRLMLSMVQWAQRGRSRR